MRTITTHLLSIALALLAGTTPIAAAAEVRFNVEPRQTYVGVPVQVRITIINAEDYRTPEFPEIEGVAVAALPPSQQSSTTIVNGRIDKQTSITQIYQLTPSKIGTFTIPSMSVVADGRTYKTDAVEISVVQSDTGDLMAAEIVANKAIVYEGEGIELTLRVWIKPYVDRQFRAQARDMWSLIDPQRSQWGPFVDAFAQTTQRQSTLHWREVLRETSPGQKFSYFQYELTQRFWPDRAGPIELGGLVIAMQYPLAVDTRFLQPMIDRARQISAVAQPPELEVKAIPALGRPPTFAGAVGRFTIQTSAKPQLVAVGDPITLTMDITDRTPDGSRLETLQPPPLASVAAFSDRFRIPSDPLAGTINRSIKTFTQTIRAANETVKEIPPVPLTYFDPQEEKFVTAWSQPIPIEVRPASAMALDSVVDARGGRGEGSSLTELPGGILANYPADEALLRSQDVAWSWILAVALALPPAVWLTAAVTRRRLRALKGDAALARSRSARRTAQQRLKHATSGAGQNDSASHVAAALSGYVADRLNLPPGAATRADIIAGLSRAGVARDRIEEVSQLLSACEQSRYAGISHEDQTELAQKVRRCIDQLHRERL